METTAKKFYVGVSWEIMLWRRDDCGSGGAFSTASTALVVVIAVVRF